jgi:hypothetical protein
VDASGAAGPTGAARVAGSARCTSRWFPMRVGATRTYRMEAAGAPGTLTLVLDAVDADGEGVIARWRARRTLEVPDQPEPVEWTERYLRRCAGAEAEEPWTGWGLPMGVMSLGPQSWRVPDALGAGVRFAGTLPARVLGRDVELRRTHEVTGVETVEVAAGRFSALRIARSDVGQATLHSTQWVAEGPGLVRAEEALGGGARLVLELVSWSDGDAAGEGGGGGGGAGAERGGG